eukprot:504204_1
MMLLFRHFALKSPPISVVAALNRSKQISVSKKRNESNDSKSNIESRLVNLMDVMSHKPGGFFSQLYNARVAFKDEFNFFEKHDKFIDDWILLRAYIAGADGLSDEEENALIEEITIWHPGKTTNEIKSIAHKGVNLTDSEIRDLGKEIADKYNIGMRHGLLHNALIAARIDGLSNKEMIAYYKSAHYMEVNADSAKDIMNLYQKEVEIQDEYNKLVVNMDEPKSKTFDFAKNKPTISYLDQILPDKNK